MVEVLLSERAYQSHGHRFAEIDAELRLVRVRGDGSLVVDDAELELDQAAPEVAWLTAEALYDGVAARFFDVVRACPTVRWVHSPAAGTDLPVYRGVDWTRVRLTSAHVNAIPIAEYVIGGVLEHFQGWRNWHDAQARTAWEYHEFREVWNTTWLVIGVGAIGSAVAERVRAFGAHVIGVRRHPRGDEPVDEMIDPSDLLAAAPRADVVVISAPGTSETHHLVDDAFLRAMKTDSVIVNIARGSIIDEDALARALDNGVPALAILDTFATEPLPPDHAFWKHPRVVVTPHSSNGGTARHLRAVDAFLDNLRRYLRGEDLHGLVDPAAIKPRVRKEPAGRDQQ